MEVAIKIFWGINTGITGVYKTDLSFLEVGDTVCTNVRKGTIIAIMPYSECYPAIHIDITTVNGKSVELYTKEKVYKSLQEIASLREVILIPETNYQLEEILEYLYHTDHSQLLGISSYRAYEAHSLKRHNNRIIRICIVIDSIGNAVWRDVNNLSRCYPVANYKVIYLKEKEEKPKEDTRTIEVPLSVAKEWYRSDNKILQGLALGAYRESELALTYKDINIEMDSKHTVLWTYVKVHEKDRKKFEAFSKLSVIADYLNNGWKKEEGGLGYFFAKAALSNSYNKYLVVNSKHNILVLHHMILSGAGVVYFKTLEDAKTAAKILGDKLADLF